MTSTVQQQPLGEEFDLPVLIHPAEDYAARKSCLVYEINDDFLVERVSERNDKVVDEEMNDPNEDESDEEFMYTLADQVHRNLGLNEEDDDDDLSLAEESYIRSGQMSGTFDTDYCLQQLEKDKADAKKTRRVRFAVNDSTGMILCHVHEASIRRLRKSDREICWYTKKDFKEFKMSVKHEMTDIRRSAYYLHFIKIFAACSSSELLRGLTQKHALLLADTPFRGFELQIFSIMLLTHRKRTHMQIQTIQSQHKNLDQVMTVSERWEKLGERCRELTKQNRRLACLYGSGDAIVARLDDVELRHWRKKTSNNALALVASVISASPLCSPTSSPRSPVTVLPLMKSPEMARKSPLKVPQRTRSPSEKTTSPGGLSLGSVALNRAMTNSPTKSPKKSLISAA